MPDVHSTFGLVLFPCSVIHTLFPNIVCKVGLRATVAAHILPWHAAPPLQLLSAGISASLAMHSALAGHFQLELWPSQPIIQVDLKIFRWKIPSIFAHPPQLTKSIMDAKRTFACNVSTSLALALAALNQMHSLSLWHGDTDGHLTVQLMKGNIPWRHPRSKGKPERKKTCVLPALLSNF